MALGSSNRQLSTPIGLGRIQTERCFLHLLPDAPNKSGITDAASSGTEEGRRRLCAPGTERRRGSDRAEPGAAAGTAWPRRRRREAAPPACALARAPSAARTSRRPPRCRPRRPSRCAHARALSQAFTPAPNGDPRLALGGGPKKHVPRTRPGRRQLPCRKPKDRRPVPRALSREALVSMPSFADLMIVRQAP